MKAISSKEFIAHPDKYLEMAIEQDIHIKQGSKVFHLVREQPACEQPVLEPDDDLRRAITAETLLEGIHEDIRRKFASRT